MRDCLYLGPVPSDEDCEQLGREYEPRRATAECTAYVNQLRRQFGEEPEGARLAIKSGAHDFGTYLEVVVYYTDDQSAEYAFNVENNSPAYWDAEAIEELASKGITVRDFDRA